MLSIISSQKLPDNQELILFRLQNNSGYYIEVLNYGATLVSVFMPDKIGNSENIILSYDQPEEYLTDTFYLGSTIGRYANRIGNACFELDGQKYELDRNDGKNTNHGGFQGFNKKFFDYKTENDSLLLHLISPDGEEKGIRLIAKPLGRPSSAVSIHVRPGERNPIEGKFRQAKTGYGLNRIRARLRQTSEAWIAGIFLVLNLIKLTGTELPCLIIKWRLSFSAQVARLRQVLRSHLLTIVVHPLPRLGLG